ncbi:VOC family protein [Humidisolicoccus flavus]|uniref:VOC family protein n=1 Tax=Humidisolicoccus flavus TaxID=3111414 RepID=UPI00324CB16B
MPTLPNRLSAITLFVDNVHDAKAFYATVFGLEVYYEDEVSTVFDFDGTLINLLQRSEAVELVAPALVAPAPTAPNAPEALATNPHPVTAQFTITVTSVDETCTALAELGVPLLNGPIDRPWGIRTAAFVDPSGHVWEIASE